MTMEAAVDRRKFGAMVVGGAAALAVAAPAVAQRRRGYIGGGMASLGQLTAGDWMTQVRSQHAAIDRIFASMLSRRGRGGMANDLMMLKTTLTAHSIAEEVALYPGVALLVDRGAGLRLYQEQQEAKILLAEIDNMATMMNMRGARPDDITGRVQTLQAAIRAHVAGEENDAYPRLMRAAPAPMNAKMTADFRMAFTRYFNG